MRKTIKNVKNGQEVSFTCSRCDSFVDIIFVPTGKKYEPNWDKIPDKCSCGEMLISRQPIIEELEEFCDNNNDKYDDGNCHKYDNGNNAHSYVSRNSKRDDSNDGHERYDVYMKDLERATSLDYFEMILKSIKEYCFEIPGNINELKFECIKRNIFCIESMNKRCCDDSFDYENRLKVLKQMYDKLSDKLSDDLEYDE